MSSSTNPNTATAANAVAVGDVVAERTVHLTRESLVRYAGAVSYTHLTLPTIYSV